MIESAAFGHHHDQTGVAVTARTEEASGSRGPPAAENKGSGTQKSIVDVAEECTVSFVILPEHYGQTKVLKLDQTIREIREALERELAIPNKSLSMMQLTGVEGGAVSGTLQDTRSLRQYGVRYPGNQIGIELRINYYEAAASNSSYVMPEVLSVTVADVEGRQRQLTVAVEKQQAAKPYQGGYRHKASGVMYHHGSTQTARLEEKEYTTKFHRDTQTVDHRTRSVQSTRETGTQMPKKGVVYVSDEHDKVISGTRYFSSADLFALRLEKIQVIQCHARGMFARRRARMLRQRRDESAQLAVAKEQRKQLEAELRHKREIQRRMHPRTYEDFAVLHKELEMWRVKETRRIKEDLDTSKEQKHQALEQLLHKETRLLQTLDKLKTQAHKQNKGAKVRKQLEQMSQPKVWRQSDNEITTVHTPYTTRAKELLDLYNGLNLPLLSIDERLDVLLHVKWTVKEFDCNLTRDIVDLIDREADMLNRGRSESSFAGLRKRLANLFLQFVETPDFNPEASRFQQVPRDMIRQTAVQPLSTVPLNTAVGRK
ncbi:unnamed protein product [Amoebophrya sp. A120]|nr:unnamed protein product [Amoebophrya sp. A120]|eukprot:GSA120T00015372001.1